MKMGVFLHETSAPSTSRRILHSTELRVSNFNRRYDGRWGAAISWRQVAMAIRIPIFRGNHDRSSFEVQTRYRCVVDCSVAPRCKTTFEGIR
jgi:hypothetical protein